VLNGLYLLYTSQNLLGTIFRVTFTVFYRRIWNIVGKYSILCCDRKAPQLPIRPNVMANRNYQVGPSQGTNFYNPVRFSNYGDCQLGCCFVCGDPNHYANACPHRGPGQGAPLILPCINCQEYGHQEGQCPKSVQPRLVYK
jgi:hypothetical protein